MDSTQDIDTEHGGYIHLITEDGQQKILNRADFQQWEKELFDQKEPLMIPWQKLTADNLGR